MSDLIDRQAAIDEAYAVIVDDAVYDVVQVETLEGLPSVEPVRHGHWDTVEDWDGDEHYQCSECGAEFVLIDGTPQDNDYLYCPHCGAKMNTER